MHLTISPCWFIYCGHMNQSNSCSHMHTKLVAANQNALCSRGFLAVGPTLFSVTLETDVVLLPQLSQQSSFLLQLPLQPLQDTSHLGDRGRGVATSTDLPYVADKRESSPTSGCNLTIDTFKIGHRGNGKPPFLPCDHTVWEMGVYLLCVCSQGGEHLLHCPLHQNPTNQAEALPSWLHVLQCLDHQTTWRGDAHHTWCWGSKGSSWHSA